MLPDGPDLQVQAAAVGVVAGLGSFFDRSEGQFLKLTRQVSPTALVTVALISAACSTVPGESAAPGSVQREVRDRVLLLALAGDPQCKQPKVVTTEMVDVYSDGRPSEELWIVEQCGRRVNYVVTFPPKRAAGSSRGFSVRPER